MLFDSVLPTVELLEISPQSRLLPCQLSLCNILNFFFLFLSLQVFIATSLGVESMSVNQLLYSFLKEATPHLLKGFFLFANFFFCHEIASTQ